MKTLKGIDVEKIDTKEFARRLINNQDMIFDFSIRLNDSGLLCWFQAINVNIMGVQCVIINHPICGSIKAYKIDIESKPDDSMKQVADMVLGLKEFKKVESTNHDNWYVAISKN